jgi:hypothetical protein
MRSFPVRSRPIDTATAVERDLVLPAAAPAHKVQFYESESFLASAVADFLAA